MSSDVFDKFDDWVKSQDDLGKERTREFRGILEEVKRKIEERYGEGDDNEEEIEVVMDDEMTRIMAEVVSRRVHVLLSMRGPEGVELMKECIREAGDDGGLTEGIISFIIDFLEEFVEQSASLDARNAALMGEVLEFVKSHNDVPEVEAFFDSKVPELDGNFMAHLNRQEKRLLASPSATVETAKLLDMVKVVKVLSTEAVGRSLSEGSNVAVIMNQLLQYDSDSTRVQVMRAGLATRDDLWKEEFFKKIDEAIIETKGMESEDGKEMRRRLETMQNDNNEFL
ncbi:hypothetical protein TrVE_jg10038 [Triparma verrucosa]|uniref:Uncharacterized protein n=1 Tax=Triparma verrucosa TaxID=1606542 RepID=A0A9W7DM33_9STRA|nr:hypothetical protein TrVE_jg10038 [Triparma verrucosa]